MPYDKSEVEIERRVVVRGEALRALRRMRDVMNEAAFLGQRRMSFSATIQVMANYFEGMKAHHDWEWLREICFELAPKLGRPAREYGDDE